MVRARPARRARGRGPLRRRRPPVPRPGGGRGDRRARLPRRAGGRCCGRSPDAVGEVGAGAYAGRCPARRGEIADLVDMRLERGAVHHGRAGPGAARAARGRGTRRGVGRDVPRPRGADTSGSGPTPSSAPPTTWSRRRPPCWGWPPGWPATARWPGAPSTAARPSIPTTPWPAWSPTCSPTRCRRPRGRRRPRDDPRLPGDLGYLPPVDTRTVGVEEELLVVDPATRSVTARAREVLRTTPSTAGALRRAVRATSSTRSCSATSSRSAPTRPTTSTTRSPSRGRSSHRRRGGGRPRAGRSGLRLRAARAGGAGGHGQRPLPGHGETFGQVARRGTTCGMHVHVAIDSAEEGVGCLDRIAPWLPVLLAVSTNSPFAEGRDTGYASWRTQLWSTWPSAGPTEPFGSYAGYRRACERMIASGAARDPGMLYFDARLSAGQPDARGPRPRRGHRPRGHRTAHRAGPGAGRDRGRRLARRACRSGVPRSCGRRAGGRPATGWPTDLLDPATHEPAAGPRGARRAGRPGLGPPAGGRRRRPGGARRGARAGRHRRHPPAGGVRTSRAPSRASSTTSWPAPRTSWASPNPADRA